MKCVDLVVIARLQMCMSHHFSYPTNTKKQLVNSVTLKLFRSITPGILKGTTVLNCKLKKYSVSLQEAWKEKK